MCIQVNGVTGGICFQLPSDIVYFYYIFTRESGPVVTVPALQPLVHDCYLHSVYTCNTIGYCMLLWCVTLQETISKGKQLLSKATPKKSSEKNGVEVSSDEETSQPIKCARMESDNWSDHTSEQGTVRLCRFYLYIVLNIIQYIAVFSLYWYTNTLLF